MTWVEPELVAAIRFTGWTDDGRLRHPSFLGLREDKPAQQVVRERALPSPLRAASARAPRRALSKRAVSDDEVAGVRISHPDRIVYPETGLTKVELARYYANVADRLLPHVVGRPLNLLRCPDGVAKTCFFQRHGHATFRAPVRHARLAGGESCVHVDSVGGLVALVQMGVIEIHPWGARIDRPDHPDRMVFDLDPDPSVPWSRVVETARLLRRMLRELELESFLKTTGGKGLHVVVPLARRQGWPQVKAFSLGVANTLARAAPDLYVATATKTRRAGRVFIDYLRNTRGASSVAAYSARARPLATVSMPIPWEHLGRTTNTSFDVGRLLERVSRSCIDPWASLGNMNQSLSAAAMRAVAAPAAP